jgi:hypothetical protein
VSGARVLDLYAGTGGVGIELVSRGAASAVLVEQEAAPLLRALERIGARPEEVRVVAAAADRALADLARAGERFDIVFADPPYGDGPGFGRWTPWPGSSRKGESWPSRWMPELPSRWPGPAGPAGLRS